MFKLSRIFLIAVVVLNGCAMSLDTEKNDNPDGGVLVTMQPVGKPKPVSIDDVGCVVPDLPLLQNDQPSVNDNSNPKDDLK